jgi:hypothetical protein
VSDLARNAVANHRSPDGLADRDPETGWIVTTLEGTVHDQCGCDGPLTRPDGPPEILRISEPVNFGQHGATLLAIGRLKDRPPTQSGGSGPWIGG